MTKTKVSTEVFAATLQEYKQRIDDDIASYSELALSAVHEEFGSYPATAVEAFIELLSRGGKRIRGALTMHAYHMLGGTDASVALQAARAVEMLHAYILMVDDIQDRSEARRSGPTAHIALKNYHTKHHLKGDAQHFGESIALNGSLYGVHQALNLIATLQLPAEVRLRAIENVNRHFVATAHGQTLDIFNEVSETVDEADVNRVLIWKTAYYTFMNPLQLGAILAGASDSDLTALEQYSLHAGKAFQITDDIIGVFGSEVETGKSPLDDVREGKRTLLTVKAIEYAPKADAYFLEQMLGNKNLTQAEFIRCKTIIESSGALAYARNEARHAVVDALHALDTAGHNWPDDSVAFLSQLVQSLIGRSA